MRRFHFTNPEKIRLQPETTYSFQLDVSNGVYGAKSAVFQTDTPADNAATVSVTALDGTAGE